MLCRLLVIKQHRLCWIIKVVMLLPLSARVHSRFIVARARSLGTLWTKVSETFEAYLLARVGLHTGIINWKNFLLLFIFLSPVDKGCLGPCLNLRLNSHNTKSGSLLLTTGH